MGDCLVTGKPFQYITSTRVNSDFHPSGVGKSSTSLSGSGCGSVSSPLSGGRNTVIPYGNMVIHSSVMGFQ